MAKKEEDETRTGKKRREMPAQVVESDDESEESDDDVMGDEFEGLAEELDSDEEDEVVGGPPFLYQRLPPRLSPRQIWPCVDLPFRALPLLTRFSFAAVWDCAWIRVRRHLLHQFGLVSAPLTWL